MLFSKHFFYMLYVLCFFSAEARAPNVSWLFGTILLLMYNCLK